MTQKKFDRAEMKKLLQENECIVEFKKVDGDKRVMPCTLNPELMPEPPKKEEGKTKRKENLSTLGVWCTDKKAWRSFRVESVTDFKVKDA